MLYVFIGCLAFGALYSLVSALLGGHGFDHGSFDHGGFDHAGFDHSGLDHSVSHDATTSEHTGNDTASGPSPFNPLVIASAITAFGAVGLIAKTGFGMGDILSTAVALGFAGLTGTLIFFGIVKFMYGSQSNSVFSLEDLTNTEAEVITPIPVNGMGEIAYVQNGVRYNLTAVSDRHEEIPRGAAVIIKEVAGNAAKVIRKVTLEELESYGLEEEKPEKKMENQ